MLFTKCRKGTQYVAASGSQGPGKVVQSIFVSIKALVTTRLDAPGLSYLHTLLILMTCKFHEPEETKNRQLWRIDRCSQRVLGVLVAPPNLALG